MKILNLYAGIGGNRALWGDEHEIVAVEFDNHVASIYQELYPDDKVIVADAHQWLLDSYDQDFDLIWSSPPCPTHSKANLSLQGYGIHRYPDMGLYQEIIFLKHFAKCSWVVENVMGYYEPLIEPTTTADRHYLWSNFPIEPYAVQRLHNVNRATKEALAHFHGIELPERAIGKRKMLRNAVSPLMGAHVLRELERNATIRGKR